MDVNLRMIAEVVQEIGRNRGNSFDGLSKALTFERAVLLDPQFKAHLADAYHRISTQHATNVRCGVVLSLAPMFRDPEKEAERILSQPLEARMPNQDPKQTKLRGGEESRIVRKKAAKKATRKAAKGKTKKKK